MSPDGMLIFLFVLGINYGWMIWIFSFLAHNQLNHMPSYYPSYPHLLDANYVIFMVKLAFLEAQLVKNPPPVWETQVQSLGQEDSPGEGKGYPLQYSGLENSMDCVVHGVPESDTTE